MSIGQITTSNTFGQLITAVAAMIAVANNLTDGPQVSSNSAWTFTNPGVGVNVGNTAIIRTANIGTLNLSTANITNATFATINVSVANLTTANIVTLNASTANISNATLARMNTSFANITSGIAVLSNLSATVANVNSGTFGVLNTSSANIVFGTAVLSTLSVSVANATVANVVSITVSAQLNAERANATVANVVSGTFIYANASFANVTVANVNSGTFGVLNASAANATVANVNSGTFGVLNTSTANVTVANVVSATFVQCNASFANITNATITTGLNTSAIISGTLTVARGGTGQTAASLVNGAVLIGNTVSGGFDLNTISQGTGIVITNDKGSISIAASGGAATDSFARDKANSKSITITTPVTTDNITVMFTEAAWNIRKMVSVVQGTATPNVVFNLNYSTTRETGNVGTPITGNITCTNTTNGLFTTSFVNANVPANNYVFLQFSSVTGTVNELFISMFA